MDFKKILEASRTVMIVGIILVAVDFVLQAASVFVISDILAMIRGAYVLILLPVFFGLYAWAGYEAEKKYGMGLAGGGLVAAAAYLVTSIVSFILTMIGIMLLWGKVGLSSPNPAGGAVFGAAMAGATGLMAALCMVGMIAIGVVVNFVVGAGGAAIADMMATKKK